MNLKQIELKKLGSYKYAFTFNQRPYILKKVPYQTVWVVVRGMESIPLARGDDSLEALNNFGRLMEGNNA